MAIIKIKRGPTVPTGLTAGELAFDYTNGNLFIGATGTTISRIAGTSFVSTFNGLSGAVSGVTTTAANTFTALQSFNNGLSAGTGVTFSSNIAVNGGSITTTSTTANVFNTTATTLNIGGASTVTTIAGVASGLTLDIANTTHFSGQKNINIATNVSGGGTQRIAIGQGGGSIVSSTGGLTFGSSSGSSITNVLGSSCNITPLTTFSNGISASGGITLNGNVSVNNLNTLNVANILANSGQLSIDNRAAARVSIGDLNVAGNGSYIFIRDNTSMLQLSNPYGTIDIGDPGSVDTGQFMYYSAQDGTLYGNNSYLSNFSGALFDGAVESRRYLVNSNAIGTQTGTTYSFLTTDNGKILTFNNSSAITVTIPTSLPVGFNCTVIQLGTGQVGFTGASGVTLNSFGGNLKISGQHGAASIIEYATNIYNIAGTLTT